MVALHETAARAFARQLGYDDVMVDGSGSNQTMEGRQAKDALKKFHEDETADMGFYGFSGGGYNFAAASQVHGRRASRNPSCASAMSS